MALPTPTPSGFVQIPNPGFESGATEWTTNAYATIVNESQLFGAWCVKTQQAGEFLDGEVRTADYFPVIPGQNIQATAVGQMTTGTPGTSFRIGILWFDSSFGYISNTGGSEINRLAIGSSQGSTAVSGSAPSNAAYAQVVGWLNVSNSVTTSTIYMDNFSWNYNFPVVATLTQPPSAVTETDNIPFRVNITGLPSGVTVASVAYYYMTWDGGDYIDPTLLSTETVAPFSFNAPPLAEGQYGGYAIVTLSNGLEITTNSRVFLVGEAPAPDTREFKASNSYTYMVGESFGGLGGAIPSTAIVTGAEVIIDYTMDVLVRSADIGITDPTLATPTVLFDIVNTGTVQAVLLDKNGSDYTINGAPMTASIPISYADFTIAEDGTSEGKRWTVYTKDLESVVTIGDESLLFGQGSINAPDFLTKALGVRFFPELNAKPAYADTGDGVIRFKINTLKLRVYFDAGSVEYYFASPDKTNVIQGTLNAGNVLSGNLASGDASGILQLDPDLFILDGTGGIIEQDWTIHSFYPPTDANQIGTVAQTMEYNGLPTYEQVEDNRSRYVFITANFYGDPLLDSIYGANGVGRAFAYNGDYFYKIVANPDETNDKPRHVAFHHSHLALGYGEGRVDLSVVGEPYNFSGLDGASSWAIGDRVTGLLPLSGAMLGIFCSKSVVGLSGTTVDNFATQTISAKLGAVEYTVTDMGFPVYANSYGIYTLEQTQQYGDFLGSPMSQAVSPWLRPRLIRRATSDREVVVAWPVRSKNQYKLAFADGYVLTMTMNYGTQSAPTFSKQKYFLSSGVLDNVDFFAYPSIVPAAISSELDESGEERIHVAPKIEVVPTYSSGGEPPVGETSWVTPIFSMERIGFPSFRNVPGYGNGISLMPPGYEFPGFTDDISTVVLNHTDWPSLLEYVFDGDVGRYNLVGAPFLPDAGDYTGAAMIWNTNGIDGSATVNVHVEY